MASLLSTGAGLLLFVGLVGALGAVAGRWFVLPATVSSSTLTVSSSTLEGPPVAPPGPLPAPEWLRARAAGFGLAAAGVTVVAMAAVFARQLAEFRDPFVPWTEDASLLLGTSWGTWWKAATAASTVTLVAFAVARFRDGSGAWLLASAGAVLLAFFPGLTGHAAGGGAPTWLLLPADALHVAAAGAWMGGLGLVLHLERAWRRTRSGADATLLPVLVPRFSPLAVAAVATLAVTGTLASWVHLPSPGALLAPGYGRTLMVKLLLVAGVLTLGALNWRRHTPGLADAEGPRTLRRAAALELALGTLVLVVTAILVRTSPSGG